MIGILENVMLLPTNDNRWIHLAPYIGIQVVPKCGVPTWKVCVEEIMASIVKKNFEYLCATYINHMDIWSLHVKKGICHICYCCNLYFKQ